jgi:hypothetical protein
MNLQKIQWESVDLFDLTHDRDKWPAVVDTVMNLEVVQGISRLGEKLFDSQKGLWSMELVS